MSFALSVFYLAVAYLGTETVFGPLAEYHLEFLLAIFIFMISVPSMMSSKTIKAPQSLALMGLALAVPLSVAMTGWVGGAVQAFQEFIPCAFAYFLVCLHCDSKKKLQWLVLILKCVCVFVIINGVIELRQVADSTPSNRDADETPYLLAQSNDAGQYFYRLRGQHFMNDPNDFGQFLVCVIPLTFIAWRPKKTPGNFVRVLLPAAVLVYGAFLTHSRGALLALISLMILAVRRRIGTISSVVLGGGAFLVASVLGFTGGREISADAGSDRTALWSTGLELLKAHPLFGVGFGRMADTAGLTAHNSIVVCAAELGLTGLYFWSLFVLPSVRDAMSIASPVGVQEGTLVSLQPNPAPALAKRDFDLDRAEVNRIGRLVLLSITGFLITGWFLSRAYAMTLFLLGGIAEVMFQMALDRGMISPRLPLTKVARYGGVLAISLILTMYVLLRVMSFMR